MCNYADFYCFFKKIKKKSIFFKKSVDIQVPLYFILIYIRKILKDEGDRLMSNKIKNYYLMRKSISIILIVIFLIAMIPLNYTFAEIRETDYTDYTETTTEEETTEQET